MPLFVQSPAFIEQCKLFNFLIWCVPILKFGNELYFDAFIYYILVCLLDGMLALWNNHIPTHSTLENVDYVISE